MEKKLQLVTLKGKIPFTNSLVIAEGTDKRTQGSCTAHKEI